MPRFVPSAAAALLLVLAACRTDPAPQAAPPPVAPAPAPAPSPGPAAPAAPPVTGLDLQANHPNGTVLRVTDVAFAADHIALTVSVTNGHTQAIELNRYGRMVLTDDQGNQYNPSPPQGDPSVTVQPGTTLNGTLVFLGRVNPAATTLTLTTNSGYGGTHDSSTQPRIVVSPIPVRAPSSAPATP